MVCFCFKKEKCYLRNKICQAKMSSSSLLRMENEALNNLNHGRIIDEFLGMKVKSLKLLILFKKKILAFYI